MVTNIIKDKCQNKKNIYKYNKKNYLTQIKHYNNIVIKCV